MSTDLATRNNVSLFVKHAILHEDPDLDAIAAYWLAKRNPGTFAGIEEAPIHFWPQSSPLDPRPQEELEADGIICFDVGEGRFDHHPHGKDSRKTQKCAFDLVAEYLGVENEIALQQILNYVRLHDLRGRNTARRIREQGIEEELVGEVMALENFSLASTISILKGNFSDPINYIEWVCNILERYYQTQIHFWTRVKAEFDRKAECIVVNDGQRDYKIATITSTERNVGSFSRTRDAGFCAICIHRDPRTGHTFISGSSQISSYQFKEITKFLRVRELAKRGTIDQEYTQTALEQSQFEICRVWYMPMDIDGEVFIIMNGGEKAVEIPPSQLSLEEVRACVTLGLCDNTLAIECPKTSCKGAECVFYKFFLERCNRVRQSSAT